MTEENEWEKISAKKNKRDFEDWNGDLKRMKEKCWIKMENNLKKEYNEKKKKKLFDGD